MSGNKHKPEMIAAWAKENGIFGYEMYDPRNRENDKRKNLFIKKDLTKM